MEPGLIERKRNRGASVRSLTPEDVNQIYAVREILERAAAAQIPLPLDRRSLAAIEAAQATHDGAVAAGDAKAVFRANFSFHDTLFLACGNPHLAAAIENFRRKTHVVWSYAIIKPEYFRNAQREHRAMIKAIRDGDRAARRALRASPRHLTVGLSPDLSHAVSRRAEVGSRNGAGVDLDRLIAPRAGCRRSGHEMPGQVRSTDLHPLPADTR